MLGFLNVYKPAGKTSHDVVADIRRVSRINHIGHTGTLDPFAEGVLPICIGKAARLIEYLKDDKAYRGIVQLGKSTDTYDIEGNITFVSDKKVQQEEIESALAGFRGEIEQVPPIYSALKVKGKKLYEYARNGEDVEIKPRRVNIQKLELIDFDFETQRAQIQIECSKGTYIRSIANDLGQTLGAGGCLIKLIRTKAGDFTLNGAVPLDEFKSADDVLSHLLSPLEYLDYPKYDLNDKEKEKIVHGMEIFADTNSNFLILTYKNELAAAAHVHDNKICPVKVFL